jgi:predicted secreted hydrolase
MKNKLLAALLVLLVALPSTGQYRKALPGYQYQFPRDHFNHPDFQTEWWYYTGNLRTAGGHRFGFELTFFRQALNRAKAATSSWDVQDVYLAHLALSDLDGGHFYHTERLNRAGPGLAGIDEASAKVWNGNWQVQGIGGRQDLQAVTPEFSLHLVMNSSKPPVIHGKNGVSQKAEGAGQASHYISFTRLLTSGTIELDGKTYSVEGTAWMDHEFFTEQVDPTLRGWDWVSLQFEDNTELMLYRFRDKDGSVAPFSAGTYIDTKGKATYIGIADFTLQPLTETYVSPDTHAVYPIGWRIAVPSLQLELQLTTPLKSQELVSGIGAGLSYWEGAITVSGTRDNKPAKGVGYLEMTRYVRPNPSR